MEVFSEVLSPVASVDDLQHGVLPLPQTASLLNRETCTKILEHSLQHSENCSQLHPDPGHPEKLSLKAELQIFLSTFFTIFLAEVGDKTQLTVLLMSAESHAPWLVFLGAGTALITTSLCGVLLGRWLSTRLSPKVLETSAGILLLGISVLLAWDVLHA